MSIYYCFVSPKLEDRVVKAWVDDTAPRSDHRPYQVELAPPSVG